MWVGMDNEIYFSFQDRAEILSVNTSNGSIDSCHLDFDEICVKPSHKGEVLIRTVVRTCKNNKCDTIKVTNSFTAITPPKINVKLNTLLLKNKSQIEYSFVFTETKKTIEGSRYQIGSFPPAITIFKDKEEIGEIFSFTEDNEIKEYLKKGNIIHLPSFHIRDMKTDLSIFTSEFDYKYR